MLRRHPTAVTVAGSLVVAGALAIALAGNKDEFVTALGSAPFWVLGAAVALHIVWLIARSEAWSVCISAAGGSVSRRRLYRASSLGLAGKHLQRAVRLAVPIAAVRRSAPTDSPRAPVLVAAELPIIVVEAALAAICSFTLVGPLGVPWWVPLICFAAIAPVIVAVVIQIARNWLLLNWSGVDASILDSTALLIGLAAVGLFPVGPSLGAAAAVLILGTNGVAASAAAGALLTVTAAVGALCFATWALVDLLWRRRPAPAAAAA